jgi:hypothetical protein
MSEQELKRRLRAHGFELVRQKKHRVFRNPSGQQFVIPSTPSDYRWSHNALADLARLCGPIEDDPRPLRAKRQHGRLDPHRVEAPEAPVAEVQPEPPKPALEAPMSRADQQRLKRWEKHDKQRGATDVLRLAKLSDIAHRAKDLLDEMASRRGNHRPGMHILRATRDAFRRVRQLGFKNIALSAATVSSAGSEFKPIAFFVRVGDRFVDIFDGVLREGPTWKTEDGWLTVEVWADMHSLSDFDEFFEDEMYLGPNVSQTKFLNLDLKVAEGRTAEYALFTALLSYEEGVFPIIILSDGAVLHGRQTLEAHALMPEGSKLDAKVIHVAVGDPEEIGRAFNAEECDWPEMIEAARQSFVDGGKAADESYVEWLRHEIAEREDDDTKAA